MVKSNYKSTKGEGAWKLQQNMENIYSGTGEKINIVLNRMKDQQQLRPTFKSKAPLKPITAKTVQEWNQIDLVNTSSIAITIEDKTYKYILSVNDIFSRYLHLYPLESKDSYGIAQALIEIYNDHKTPEIIQSDQGSEFKGTMTVVCKQMNAKIIRSSAYTPTTKERILRGHIWHGKRNFAMTWW